MTGARIDLAGFGTSDTWVRWTPGEATTTAQETAAAVTSSDEARDAVASWLLDVDARLTSTPEVFAAAGWVPDPASGEVPALVVATVGRGDAASTTRSEFARQQERAPDEPGTEVLGRHVLEVDLEIGPAVVEVVISAAKRSWRDRRPAPVDNSIIWTVFPTGFDDTVVLHARTPYDALFDGLADEARLMVDHLAVTAEGAA